MEQSNPETQRIFYGLAIAIWYPPLSSTFEATASRLMGISEIAVWLTAFQAIDRLQRSEIARMRERAELVLESELAISDLTENERKKLETIAKQADDSIKLLEQCVESIQKLVMSRIAFAWRAWASCRLCRRIGRSFRRKGRKGSQ